ncbi:MAG: DUF1304 family protein [Nostoc sp. NMS7]|nr:DUF1304 family protein [Nostoc sp. NMS7]
MRLFFLVCVIVAGLYGVVTLKPTTIVFQMLPAMIALIIVSSLSFDSNFFGPFSKNDIQKFSL